MSDIQKLKDDWMRRDKECLDSLREATAWGDPSFEQRLFFESERVKDLVRLVFVLADEIDTLKQHITKPPASEIPNPTASD